MKKLSKLWFIIWPIGHILFFSCKGVHEPIIPNEVINEYNTFMYECQTRGVDINVFNLDHISLQGEITKDQSGMESGVVAGYYNESSKIIYLDTTHWAYKKGKEEIIFHELGHALLRRGHRPDLLQDGETPASIMHCCTPVSFNNFTIYRRVYYLDELFNQNTPYPYWSANWK